MKNRINKVMKISKVSLAVNINRNFEFIEIRINLYHPVMLKTTRNYFYQKR